MAWWTAVAGGALGKVFGKIIDHIPGREESIRNKIDALEKERDEIIREGIPANKYRRLERILDKLRKLQKTLENR